MEPETQSTLAMSSGEAIDLEAVARVSRGVLDGAVFALAMPRHEEWNGCLLLHAHGFRPHGMGLVAEVDDPFWWRLVQQGWAVGVTSYRRTGLIVADAIKDLNNLRNHVCNEFGYPYWVFLDGRSMGGAISVRIAEQPNVKTMYSGVMAIGAALLVKEDHPHLKLTHRPTLPILFLTNSSEIGPINDYIAGVKKNAEEELKAGGGGDELRVPALHLVTREGHNWTNPRERWRAFSTLVEWAFVGSLVTEYLFDGTKPGTARPGTAKYEFNKSTGLHKLIGKILSSTNADTDLRTSMTVQDMFQAKIRLNSKFKIAHADGRDMEAYFGAYPFVGIPDDAVVAAEDPEGFIIVFDMSEFRNKIGTTLRSFGFKRGEDMFFLNNIASSVKKLAPRLPPIKLAEEDQSELAASKCQ